MALCLDWILRLIIDVQCLRLVQLAVVPGIVGLSPEDLVDERPFGVVFVQVVSFRDLLLGRCSPSRRRWSTPCLRPWRRSLQLRVDAHVNVGVDVPAVGGYVSPRSRPAPFDLRHLECKRSQLSYWPIMRVGISSLAQISPSSRMTRGQIDVIDRHKEFDRSRMIAATPSPQNSSRLYRLISGSS